MGMSEPKLISVIRHYGDPKTATTLDGRKVERQDKILVPEWGAFILCAPYDDHFVYQNFDPVNRRVALNQPSYMCTCGSAAGIVPPSLNGMLVCLYCQSYGVHATGGTRWV